MGQKVSQRAGGGLTVSSSCCLVCLICLHTCSFTLRSTVWSRRRLGNSGVPLFPLPAHYAVDAGMVERVSGICVCVCSCVCSCVVCVVSVFVLCVCVFVYVMFLVCVFMFVYVCMCVWNVLVCVCVSVSQLCIR